MNELHPDPHLQAALRHAPDAHLEAPPEIAARVMAEARRAVALRPRPPWWARWWQRAGAGWMPQGALATLLLAGLITLLWRDDRPGPAPASAPIAESVAAAPGAVAAPAVAEAAPVAPAPVAAPADGAQRPALQAKAADTTRDSASAQPERRREPAPAPEPAVAAAAPLPSPPPSPVPPAPAIAIAPAPTDAAVEAASPPPRPAPAAAAAFNRMALAAAEPAPWGDPPGPDDRLLRPGLEGDADPVWLIALSRSIAAPWQDTGAPAPARAPTLVWEREGAPHGRLWIERREAREWVVWCAAATAQARCQQAPLRGEAPAPPR